MKQLLHALFLIGFALAGHAQQEFQQFPNGFMYSESTMFQLTSIVDSLNLQFRSCELDRPYFAQYQAKAHYVELHEGNLIAARRDIADQIPFEDFLRKYPAATIGDSLLITKTMYEDYQNESVVKFRSISLDGGYGHQLSWQKEPEKYSEPVKGRWYFKYWRGSEHSERSLRAFYFLEEFSAPELPESYARLVQYTDCMIDTSSQVYIENATEGDIYLPVNFQEQSRAANLALLEQMRSTRVVGYCSQDDRPRIHARNIAILSAETANWEVFLRAHLDIMNDRFERATDGSYAWGQRQTYIQELEALNIEVTDLLIGISLRVENAGENHYFGRVDRTGRALAESEKADEVADTLLAMIADEDLDDYNRILLYYLYRHFAYHQQNEQAADRYMVRLKQTVAAMPDYLARTVNWE